MKTGMFFIVLASAQAAYQGEGDTEGAYQEEGYQQDQYQEQPAYIPVAETYEPAQIEYHHTETCHGQCHHNAPCWDAGTQKCVATVCASKGGSYGEVQPEAYGAAQNTYSGGETYGGQATQAYGGETYDRKLQGDQGYGTESKGEEYQQEEGDNYAPEPEYPSSYAYASSERHYACGNCACPNTSQRCSEGCASPSKTGRVIWWIGFVIFLLSALGLSHVGLKYKGENSAVFRILPLMSAAICLVAAMEYLTLANGRGMWSSCPEDRPVYLARYISWMITVPLLLLMLGIVGGLHQDRKLFQLIFSIIMVLSGLWGSFPQTKTFYRWIFLAVGSLQILHIWRQFTFATAWDPTEPTSTVFRNAVNATVVVFALYGLVWLLSEVANAICADTEILLYMLLDLITKPGMAMFLHSSVFSASAAPKTKLAPLDLKPSSFI